MSTPNSIESQTFGGQVLRANLMGKDIFYCPDEHQAPPTPARGGVPVLFPQFEFLGPLKKHGLVRTMEWNEFALLEGCVSNNLLLTEQPDWPHRAQLNLDASIEDDRMEIFLEIRNVGDSAFEWTGGLHPYFLVHDVLQSRVEGLVEIPVFDVSAQNLTETLIDQAYGVTPSLKLFSPNVNLLLEQEGFDAWQVWNPSAQHKLTDIPHADWQRFLCVEPIVHTPRTLAAGETWIGRLTLTLLD